MSLDRLINSIRNNEVILWAGAGFSLYAGMPSVDKIKSSILERCDESESEYLKKISSLSEIANEFIQMRNGSRNELNTILMDLIDKEPDSISLHKFLSEIPQIDKIVTTNYDHLFEKAYGNDIFPIISNANIPYASRKRVDLYKIHGDIKVPDSLLISSDDYTDFFNREHDPIWTKIKSLIAEKSVLFIGYSIADQNIDYLINNVIKSIGKNQKECFLIAPGIPKHKLAALKNKKIEYIDMTGEEFIPYIHEQIKKK